MSQQYNSNNNRVPSLSNILTVDENNTNNDNPDNTHNHQSVICVNASSSCHSPDEVLTLVCLFGDYYRETNQRERAHSPNRVQINQYMWEELTKKFNEETDSNRTSKALSDKWDKLKSKYMND
jgi:hypothetical protein